MRMVIAGGTGFLGNALEKYFTKDYNVYILTRSPMSSNHIYWDGKTIGDWSSLIDGADILINLSGKSVDCRYTKRNKNAILGSRIDSTSVLTEAIAKVKKPPSIWLNASSATIYVDSHARAMTEKNGVTGDDFSMSICKKWENEFFKNSISGIRKVALRTSIVLGNEGGAFPKMKLLSIIGLGGSQGNGEQYISWIHIDDFCMAIEFIIEHQHMSGQINITAPEPVTNKTFMRLLAKYTRPLIRISTPTFLLKLGAIILRTETELVLKSRKVFPEVLLNTGFKFKFDKLEFALQDLLEKKRLQK